MATKTISTHTCDRCGAVITNANCFLTKKLMWYRAIPYLVRVGFAHLNGKTVRDPLSKLNNPLYVNGYDYRLDLCTACQKSFLEWLKEERKVK